MQEFTPNRPRRGHMSAQVKQPVQNEPMLSLPRGCFSARPASRTGASVLRSPGHDCIRSNRRRSGAGGCHQHFRTKLLIALHGRVRPLSPLLRYRAQRHDRLSAGSGSVAVPPGSGCRHQAIRDLAGRYGFRQLPVRAESVRPCRDLALPHGRCDSPGKCRRVKENTGFSRLLHTIAVMP